MKIGREGLKPIDILLIMQSRHGTEYSFPILPTTPERLLKPYKEMGLPISIAKYYANCTV